MKGKNKVVLGMSGGVDSSVAAYLLKEQGFEVTGVTMRLMPEQEGENFPAEADARQVAEVLGIAHYVIDFSEDFRRHVIDYFAAEYMRGRTPNPCNACNRYVKWESLLKCAAELGADGIATGHYARIVLLKNGRFSVRGSATAEKDQTYALCNLKQEQLSRTWMPVGEYGKDEIRKLAELAKLPVADKRDSQDICFVPDGDYAGFIERMCGHVGKSGNFVDETGKILGRHKGILHYTIGQRKGLGISADAPLFVKELRSETNEVVLCPSERLFARGCVVEHVNYMARERLLGPTPAVGKIRYSHAGSPCMLYPQPDGGIRCEFEEPQRAITPGQSAVFYEDGCILCGGVIQRQTVS